MSVIDWAVLLGTLGFIVGYGIWRTRTDNSQNNYLRGGSDTRWWGVGLSVMATQASAVTASPEPPRRRASAAAGPAGGRIFGAGFAAHPSACFRRSLARRRKWFLLGTYFPARSPWTGLAGWRRVCRCSR